MNKKLWIITLALTLAVTGIVFAQSERDFEISQNQQGKITITDYTGSTKEVVIPSKISGIEVSAIEGSAFYKKGLTKVVFPDTITSIGDSAFQGNKLEDVTLPKNLRFIDHNAFAENSLYRINLPSSLEEIGGSAFYSNLLTYIRIPENVKTIGAYAFAKNKIEIVEIPKIFTARLSGGVYSEIFKENSIGTINICANWDTRLLSEISFDSNFVNYYTSQGRKAGIYDKYDRIWKTLTKADFDIYVSDRLSSSYRKQVEKYIYGKDEDFVKGITIYNEAIRTYPKNVDLFRYRAQLYNKKGDYDKAISDCNEALRIEPNNNLTFMDRAEIYLNKGDYDKAIADYSDAIRIDPNQVTYRMRASVYFKKGDNDKAIADYSEAIKIDENASNYSLRGSAYMQKGDFTNARTDANKALQLSPNYREAKDLDAELKKKGY